tara:strand:+ start:2574 stop:2720 length:147 start_codon:yes stop_codon:yes gene_type:complete
MKKPIRCPHCAKKFGDYLEGVYRTFCPRCKRDIEVIRSGRVDTAKVIV